jgi:3-oxoacyl-[acyl-carrier-protein] synthase II
VVVTGMGVTTALGFTVSDFWEALLAARSGISRIRNFDASGHDCQIAGEIRDFDPQDVIDPKVCNRLDRFAQFALAAAGEAVKMSGLDFARENTDRVGVVVGSGIGGLHEIEAQHLKLLERGPRRISPLMIPKLMLNAAAGQISIVYGLRGPNSSTASACASAAHAIGEAVNILRLDEADVMITGGAEAAITPLALAGFCAQKALSTRNDDPEHASRPFDLGRDGFVMGEGAGLLVLEELDHARRRDARIYAELLGFGASGDGYNIVAPHPEGEGAARAMSNALASAHVNPDQVGYINAHGTSTPLGDIAECIAINKVFGGNGRKVPPVSATKSMTGHLLGASAGVEMVATVLSIAQGVIHPTANIEKLDPQCRIDPVPNEPRELDVRVAISNSFGFGGHNAAVVVGKFDD